MSKTSSRTLPTALAGVEGFQRDTVIQLSEHLNEPAWYRDLRLAAWERYESLEMPRWQRTDLSDLDLQRVVPLAEPDAGREITPDSLIEEGAAARFHQVDARPVHLRVDEELQRKGLVVSDMATAVREHADKVRPYLEADLPDCEEAKFLWLQRALGAGGIFIYVPRGLAVSAPVHAAFRRETAGAALLLHNLVVVEDGAQLIYLEEYDSAHDGRQSVHIGRTELRLGQGAHLRYTALQNFDPDVFEIVVRDAYVGRDANYRGSVGSFGGRLSRSAHLMFLDGQGADGEYMGVYLAGGDQHYDMITDSNHQSENTRGETLVKGVLTGRARSIFQGMIRVLPGAQQTNAYLTDNTLVLSEDAHADAIPGLEIEADEVKASHGATVGQIDEQQIFYLMSRGLTRLEARQLIVLGFLEPVLRQIPDETARRRFERLISEKVDS